MNTNTLPRPTRRPRACALELTPAGLETTHRNARRAVSSAIKEYADLAASMQEGASIPPALRSAVGERYLLATRLEVACCTLTHGPARLTA